MSSAEMEKPTSHCSAPVLTRLVEDTLIELLQVGYDVIKEGVMAPSSIW